MPKSETILTLPKGKGVNTGTSVYKVKKCRLEITQLEACFIEAKKHLEAIQDCRMISDMGMRQDINATLEKLPDWLKAAGKW